MKNGIFCKIIFITVFSGCGFFIMPQNKPANNLIDFYNIDSCKEAEAVIVKVGNLQVTAKEFLYGYEFGPSFIKQKKNSKKRYLDYLINEKLLAQEGFKNGLESRDIYKKYYSAVKGDLVTDELYKNEILGKVSLSEDEISKGVNKKAISLVIKWLYTKTENDIVNCYTALQKGISFDSLFKKQLSDSVFADQRSMEIDRFNLGKKNPVLASMIDTIKPGVPSMPIHTGDGWYIIKLDNVWKSAITTETENNKNTYDVEAVLKREKADSISDIYVREAFRSIEPVIKKKALLIVRSYIGKTNLDSIKYIAWGLDEKLNRITDSLKALNITDYNSLPLVETKTGVITINSFLQWFQLRSENINLDESSLKAFSVSLENVIWRMLRDETMLKRAYALKLDKAPDVVEQSNWWKDKIMYAIVRDEIGNSIALKGELNLQNKQNETRTEEFTKKLLHKIIALKQKTKIEINEELLSRIIVSQENDAKAIEVYTSKTGGYFPRQAYPSIDLYWKTWE